MQRKHLPYSTMPQPVDHYEPSSKLVWQGVYVSRDLSFGCLRKAIRENAMVANPAITRETRPSGMTPGAETWTMGVGLRAIEKSVDLPPNPKVARAAFLSRLWRMPGNRHSRSD